MAEQHPFDQLKHYYKIDGISHDEIVQALKEKHRDDIEKDSSYDAISKLYTDEVSRRLGERLQSRIAALKEAHSQAVVDTFSVRCETLLKNGQYYLSDSDFSELFAHHLENKSNDEFFTFYLSLVSKNVEPLSGL